MKQVQKQISKKQAQADKIAKAKREATYARQTGIDAPVSAKLAPADAPVSVKAESAQKAVKGGLYRLVQTPGGNILRAYFVGMITAQDAFKTGAPFRLWSGINVSGHIAKENLRKADSKYTLSAHGHEMFRASIEERGLADLVAKMAQAVKNGKAIEGYSLGQWIAF